MANPRKYEALIEVDAKGKASTYNAKLLADFFAMHPNSRFTAIFSKVGTGKKDRLRAYYFSEVVTKFQIGLRSIGYNFTKEETHQFIKQFSPIMEQQVEMNGEYHRRLRSLTDDDFTKADFMDYIADLKQFAAENLSIIINDPGDYSSDI